MIQTEVIKLLYCLLYTSANAVKIVKALPNKNIFFIPDKNLAHFIAEQVPEKNFVYNEGYLSLIHIFPKEYAPKEVIAMLNERKQELLCVRGNCDTEVDQMVLEFPILADYCFLNLDGQNIYATHGHVWNPGKLPMLKAGDILLNGHTHLSLIHI